MNLRAGSCLSTSNGVFSTQNQFTLSSPHPLKKLLSYLREHFRADFHTQTYGLTLLFLACTIVINYRLDFEDSVIDAYYGQEIRMVWYMLFYGTAYYGTVLLMAVHPENRFFLRDPRFWLLSAAGLVILAVNDSFYYHTLLAKQFAYPVQWLASKCLGNLRSLLTVLLPLALVYRLCGNTSSGFYGIRQIKTDWRPYLLMLLVMLPLVTVASFGADFQRVYPKYVSTSAALYLHVPEWLTVLLFELAYGWDFVATEWLFRGFFVLGMASVTGRRAVLPMVVTYAFLHFGKPLGETISSVFGGYVLGVIALRTNSIWGGIAIHLGVAWLMELAALVQKSARFLS